MENQSYHASFSVDQSPDEAFRAVTNVRGWWSEEIEGGTDKLGDEFKYHYKDVHRCTMKLTELIPGRRVVWHVLENYFDFVQDQGEWLGTELVFDISPENGGARVEFTHVGLFSAHECFDVCSNAWTFYVNTSLRNLITSGEGQPNKKGAEAGVPAH